MPISKNLRAVAEASALGDRKCMAFSATTVSAGQGLGVVTATGRQPGRRVDREEGRLKWMQHVLLVEALSA